MGFSDAEIVALSGAHSLGRCHADRSGFVGPWTRAPTTFSNEYFRLLLEETWVPEASKAAGGPSWFVNKGDRSLMMLPSDLALKEDPVFKAHVVRAPAPASRAPHPRARAFSHSPPPGARPNTQVEYAKDGAKFSKDFAAAFSKLLSLGVPFPADSAPIVVQFKGY